MHPNRKKHVVTINDKRIKDVQVYRKTLAKSSSSSIPQGSITVEVPQGLGDIFWVYQKLAPYFNQINFSILVMKGDEVSKRSEAWLNLLPKVKSVGFKLVYDKEYYQLINKKYYVKDILSKWQNGTIVVKYSCNLPLEEGKRLDEIDEFAISSDIPLKSESFAVPFDEFVTLYISGATKSHGNIKDIWTVDQWIECVQLIYHKLSRTLPIIMIGANFDRDIMYEATGKLLKEHIPTVPIVQETPARVCHILKNTKLFLGYQSGLNIIADNLDTKQVMIYFDKLHKMQYTWCKEKNIKSRFFAGLFTQSPAEVVNSLGDFNI